MTTVRPAVVTQTRHCPVDKTEWNGITETSCWFCGGFGLPGRVPKPDGRSMGGMPAGCATWTTRDEAPPA